MKKHGMFFLISILFFSTVYSEVDYSSGNMRIKIEDFNGAISLYRKVYPVVKKDEDKVTEETLIEEVVDAETEVSVAEELPVEEEELSIEEDLPVVVKKGASGTLFGVVPDSVLSVKDKEKKQKVLRPFYEPLLDTSRYTSNSSFYLLVDDRLYALSRCSHMSIESYSDEMNKKSHLEYYIEDVASVSLTFEFFSSHPEDESFEDDSIKVSIAVNNLSEEHSVIALKGVFDTCLGEHSGSHFSTARREFLNSEIFFTTMNDEKWIQTASQYASAKFLFYGDTITNPQTVAVANKDVLSSASWTPSLKIGRSFNSIISYNNSAISVTWKPEYLESNGVMDITYYITTAQNDEWASDAYDLGLDVRPVPKDYYLSEGEDEVVEEVPVEVLDKLTAIGNATMVADEEERARQAEAAKRRKYELDMSYVKELLARVEELKQSPRSSNEFEIKILQREIERIIEGLQQ